MIDCILLPSRYGFLRLTSGLVWSAWRVSEVGELLREYKQLIKCAGYGCVLMDNGYRVVFAVLEA